MLQYALRRAAWRGDTGRGYGIALRIATRIPGSARAPGRYCRNVQGAGRRWRSL